MEGNCRITVLNERLLRVEYNERGRFLDSPSFAFISRATRSEPRICTIGRSGALGTAPDITESALGSERHAKDDLIVLAESHQLRLCLDTRSGYLLAMTQQCRKTVLEYVDSGAVDAAETAAASKNDPPRMKYRTVRDPQNQGGTIQTLDECDGWYHIRKLVDIRQNGIGEGFFSADGLAIINDSNSLVFMGKNWSDPLDEQGFVTRAAFFGGSHDHLDLVLFEHSPKGPEQSFPEILREYLFPYIGAPPKPPLEVFGVWFCRYWPYRQQDIIDLVLRFENRSEPESAPHRGQANASQPCRLPAVDLSIFVIDMDWHQPDQWTGFSWNRALFPDPEALMAWLHSRPCPVRVALNLHPADGIAPNEDMFLQARALAYPEHNETEHIPFHIMDCRFRQAYFSVVLNALENQIAANEMRMIKHGVKRDGFDPMPLPLPLGRERLPQRTSPAGNPVAMARSWWTSLSRGILRGYPGNMGFSSDATGVHRYGGKRGVLLLVARHWWPLRRLRGSRALRALASVGLFFADLAPALQQESIHESNALGIRLFRNRGYCSKDSESARFACSVFRIDSSAYPNLCTHVSFLLERSTRAPELDTTCF